MEIGYEKTTWAWAGEQATTHRRHSAAKRNMRDDRQQTTEQRVARGKCLCFLICRRPFCNARAATRTQWKLITSSSTWINHMHTFPSCLCRNFGRMIWMFLSETGSKESPDVLCTYKLYGIFSLRSPNQRNPTKTPSTASSSSLRVVL